MKRALLLSLIAGMPGAASAAAWTQEEGEAVVILQIAGALAEARFNAFGTRTESDRFESVEGRVYAEYGLFDAYTLVASGGFKQFTAEPNPAVQGADPFELALRVRLFTWENNVVSVQPGVRIPGSFSGGGGDVPFGSEDFDVEGVHYSDRRARFSESPTLRTRRPPTGIAWGPSRTNSSRTSRSASMSSATFRF